GQGATCTTGFPSFRSMCTAKPPITTFGLPHQLFTVAESYAVTVAESDALTVAEPDAVTVAESYAVTVAEPDAVTVAEPDAVTVAEPDAHPTPLRRSCSPFVKILTDGRSPVPSFRTKRHRRTAILSSPFCTFAVSNSTS